MDPVLYYALAGVGLLVYVCSVLVLLNMVFISTKFYNIVDTNTAGCTVTSMFLFMPLGVHWAFDGYRIIPSNAAIFIVGIFVFGSAPLYLASFLMKRRFPKPITVRS